MRLCSFASLPLRRCVLCPFTMDEASELLEKGDRIMRGRARREVTWLALELRERTLAISPDRCRRIRARPLTLLPLDRSLRI